ncbi:tyrosine-type recombinase/integrase [Actinomadura sp. DC4]|uniref:tyrosine-type recombinase/integrase n=1 Tax=Actinomadura sp. DC4 TaxID=3055069 RepID=UPI0025B1D686|nr:tyrosine-type recombinase/integrase [Actinomadura sp. DC4]MDN3356284.1 tyrosine-type recombinase/integrase [Actinomadura sp. DC4]
MHEKFAADGALFSDAKAEFFLSIRPAKPAPGTVAGYDSDLRIIGEISARLCDVDFGELRVGRLTGRVLRSAFAEFADDHAAASILRAWSAWNRFMNFAVAEELVDGNPMAAVPHPKAPSKAPKPFQGDGTAQTLLERIAAGAREARDPWVERDLVALAFPLVTGARSAELLGVTLGAFGGSPGDRRVQLTGKGGKTRSVPVEVPLERLVDAYLASRMERFGAALPLSAPLLVNTRNEPLQRGGLQYLVSQCYRFAGVHDRVSRGALVHTLRHEFATRLAENGASAHELKELLGHSSIATGQHYVESTARELRMTARTSPTYGVLDTLLADAAPLPRGEGSS